jgi:ribonuclease P protein component
MVPTSLPSRDIRAVYAARHVVHGQFLSLYGRVRAEDGQGGRTAVVAGRRVGSAVDRNRARRRLRAVLRDAGVPASLDVVVVAKLPARTVPYPLLSREYERLRGRLLARLERAA